MPQDYHGDQYTAETYSFAVIGRFADPLAFAGIWTALIESAVYPQTGLHLWEHPGVWQLFCVGMAFALAWLIVPGTWLGRVLAQQFMER